MNSAPPALASVAGGRQHNSSVDGIRQGQTQQNMCGSWEAKKTIAGGRGDGETDAPEPSGDLPSGRRLAQGRCNSYTPHWERKENLELEALQQ